MIFRQWARGHLSLLVTATSGVLVAVLVATAAFVSGGFTAQRMDLGDASVWVANGERQYVGRANTDVLELNTVVASDGGDLDIVQAGSSVLIVDRADARVDIVDAATAEVTDSVPLPPDGPDVFLAGSNVVIYSEGTGQLWSIPLDELGSFDADREPTLNLGVGSVVSVNDAGLLFAFSPAKHQVYRVNAAVTGVVEATSSSRLTSSVETGEFTLTSVGDHWVIFDAATNELEVDGVVSDLTTAIVAGSGVDGDAAAAPVLQWPSAGGDRVLIGVSGGLLTVPFGSDEPRMLVTGESGTPARPASLDGCDFGAWTGGSTWRHCGTADGEGVEFPLAGLAPGSRLAFRHNGDRLLLNDSQGGSSWAVQQEGQLIDNWADLIEEDEQDTEVTENDDDSPTVVEKEQQPPVAVDDTLGARPGRATVLPVLLNDYDPNGDVLVIEGVSALSEAVGRIDPIAQRQQLQLTLAADASGTFDFDYTITDGRGGTSTATVTIEIRTAEENSAPRQVRSTSLEVASGSQQSLAVLGDWLDPDGDPFYLTSAQVPDPDSVSYKPEGTVIVTSSGSTEGDVTVALVASDGTDEGSGSLEVTIAPRGTVPIIADPFVVLAYAGQEVTVSPLDHVRGGTGEIRLNAVPPKSGVTTTPSYETGTFRFVSDAVRTHYLEYVVTDDDQTVTGIVRVDVAAPPDATTEPITVPKTVFVRTLSSAVVDVAGTDIDPAGGVLLVTGVDELPDASGVRSEVIEQRSVRVSLVGPLGAPVTFGYQVSNGLAEVDGTITVIEIPQPSRIQPPVARDDTATARVGDAITIDVLANDEQPDGLDIAVSPRLVEELTGSSGFLFVTGNTLRYLAPATPGNYSAVYAITGPDGQSAQAQVQIEVREPNLETNTPPVPVTLTARVLAGERVRVDVPLVGIDPDGDSVKLLGQESNPEKGAVTAVGTNYIEYQAGEYSAGTDTFSYAVIDSLGSRASGTVRVGIAPRSSGPRNPVAVEDEVTSRPGTTVSVQVLENDSDPDGSPLTVIDVEPNGPETTAIIEPGGIVTITPPAVEGRYGLVYTIRNENGGTSQNFITVTVDKDAALSYPLASDTVLTLSDVLDRDTVDVDVLANVFFADGESRALGVSVLSGYGSDAQVTADKRVRVRVGDESQIIPFAVAHPDDPSVRSFAFIWVPGFNDALPQLDTRAPALTVRSEDTLRIELNDQVIAVGGKQVRLTDSSGVRATHSNGASLVVDSDTLSFTSAALFSGPASISFEVTDGSSAADPDGRVATLVLPITVTPRQNQPPVFTGASIDFEPAQTRVIDLRSLTNFPNADAAGLTYAVVGTPAVGFSATISGQTLSLTADESATAGSVTALGIGVTDALGQGQAGRIALRIVPSTRPLARPAADVALTKRGQTTLVDVLQNDQATNPFPGEPLRVVAVRGADGSSLPSGVSVDRADGGSTLTVTVSKSAKPTDSNLQYQVADATGDPARYVWGNVRISVQDVPEAPVKPVRQADAFVGGELKLRMTAPQSNNSAITGYSIVSDSHGEYSQDCGTALICSLTGLDVGAEYRFRAVATNAIGDSEPSALSDVYTIDYRPAAPASVSAGPSAASAAPNGRSITVTWPDVPDPEPGSPIVGYTVVVTGPNVDYTATATSPFVTTAGGQLSNDTNYSVTVYARNSAQVISDSEWRRTTTSVRTVGPPSAPRPSPKATINSDNDKGEIRVTWGTSDANGSGSMTYSVGRAEGSVNAPSCSTGPGKPYLSDGVGASNVSSGWVDTRTVDGATYTYFVYADNGVYCTATATGTTESKRPPGTAVGTASVEDSGSGQLDIRANGDLAASGIVEKFQYRLNGSGGWRNVKSGDWLTTRGDSSNYGLETTVTYRACRDSSENYCGPESEGSTVIPLDLRAGISSCIPDTEPQVTAPSNAGDVLVQYRFAYSLDGATFPGGFAFGENDTVPSLAVAVRVRATVTVFGESFTDTGYGGEVACQ